MYILYRHIIYTVAYIHISQHIYIYLYIYILQHIYIYYSIYRVQHIYIYITAYIFITAYIHILQHIYILYGYLLAQCLMSFCYMHLVPCIEDSGSCCRVFCRTLKIWSWRWGKDHLFLQGSNCLWFRNPANQLRLVVYPILYRDFYIPGGAGFLPSTVPSLVGIR